MKRLFDIIIGTLLLPLSFLSGLSLMELIKCIFGSKTLVGYNHADGHISKLPQLKASVIPINDANENLDKIHRLNVAYAMQYSPFLDFKILLRQLFSE